MRRYLLFKSNCSLCTSIAEEIQHIAGSWLHIKSFDDPEIIRLRGTSRADRPVLLAVKGSHAEEFRGVRLSWALIRGLGIRRSRRILGLMARDLRGTGVHRRSFITGAAGALALATLGTLPAKADPGPRREDVILERARIHGARTSADVRRALEVIDRDGFDPLSCESVLLDIGPEAHLVMLIAAHRDRPITDAAVIMQKVEGESRDTRIEYVSGDVDLLIRDGSFHAEELTVSSPSSENSGKPYSAGAYIGCIAACVGASCGLQAARCAGLAAMPLVLTCMTVVCGSKARTCHGVCRRLW